MPVPARHPAWADLPADLLDRVFRLLLPQGEAWAVPNAVRLLACLSACRHWRGVALRTLRPVSLRCDAAPGDLAGLLLLASAGLHSRHLWLLEGAAETWPSQQDPLACPAFWQQVAPRLQLLAGVPACAPGWPWALLRGACASLRALHLHSEGPELAVGGPAWRSLGALTQLAVTTGPWTVVSVEAQLPPSLRRLTAATNCLYLDLPLLLAVPRAQLAVRELYAVPNTPENNATYEAPVMGLRELAAAAAAAVSSGQPVPAGHRADICTQGIWYKQHPGCEPAWLHALFTSDEMPDEPPPPQQQALQALQAPPPAPPTPKLPRGVAAGQQPLPPLLRQPPAEVLAAFTASEPRGGRELVAAAGSVTARLARARSVWPHAADEDHQRLAAMRLCLQS